MNTMNTSISLQEQNEMEQKYKQEVVAILKTDLAEKLPEGSINIQVVLQNDSEDKVVVSEFLDSIESSTMFIPRYLAEKNTDFRQPIAYPVVRNHDGKYLLLEVLNGGGEKRLHGTSTIGSGGHVEPKDAIFSYLENTSIVTSAAMRELHEELQFINTVEGQDEVSIQLNFVGLLNHTQNEVSRDHIGFMYIVETDSEFDVVALEQEKHTATFYTLEEIEQKDNLDDWSKLAIQIIKELDNKGE